MLQQLSLLAGRRHFGQSLHGRQRAGIDFDGNILTDSSTPQRDVGSLPHSRGSRCDIVIGTPSSGLPPYELPLVPSVSHETYSYSLYHVLCMSPLQHGSLVA